MIDRPRVGHVDVMQTKDTYMPLDPPAPAKAPLEAVIDLRNTEDSVAMSSLEPCKVDGTLITYFLERTERRRLVRFVFPEEADGYVVELAPRDPGVKNRLTLPIDSTVEALLAFVPTAAGKKKPKIPFNITIGTRQKGAGQG